MTVLAIATIEPHSCSFSHDSVLETACLGMSTSSSDSECHCRLGLVNLTCMYKTRRQLALMAGIFLVPLWRRL